jgi:prevent-host-death family protein
MANARFSEDVRPITDMKLHASSLVEQAQRSGRPVLLTRRGRGVAVLLAVEEYERLVDRASFVSAVEAGAEAIARGDVHGDDEAQAILDTFGKRAR